MGPHGSITILLSVVLTLTCLIPNTGLANILDRDRDPLVLLGSSLPWLLGADPSRIVGFRYEGGWIQIPVQVDERAVVDFGDIYGAGPIGFTIMTYTDTSTFVGGDPDPSFDSDDELILMAREAGGISTASAEPQGVVPGSGLELVISNPLNGASAYVYLFESDGTLDPGAGGGSVVYSFNLLSGGYKATYNTATGPNPEDSQIATPAYQVHFADRWIRDETGVTKGGASGVDVLDRHKSLFAPGNCSRSERTFSNGEGAFIVNRSGPVRALRGYVGANSGPTTHRIHLFYEEREDILTALRVHLITGIMDYYDYSPAAAGMTYYDDLNMGGVPIDGVPDVVANGEFTWEMVTGSQGSMVHSMSLNTDIPGFDYTSYYSDNVSPLVTQCTGDDFEYGASGFWETDVIPNTDPFLGPFNIFEATRILAYGAPNQNILFAQRCHDEASNPLSATAAPYEPAPTTVEDRPGGYADSPEWIFTAGPNPFRSGLELRYSVPGMAAPSIEVFDLAGRRIRSYSPTSVSGHLVWNGETDSGGRASPGVYFIRIDANRVSATRRVMLIR